MIIAWFQEVPAQVAKSNRTFTINKQFRCFSAVYFKKNPDEERELSLVVKVLHFLMLYLMQQIRMEFAA
jgi:hypothetical protein